MDPSLAVLIFFAGSFIGAAFTWIVDGSGLSYVNKLTATTEIGPWYAQLVNTLAGDLVSTDGVTWFYLKTGRKASWWHTRLCRERLRGMRLETQMKEYETHIREATTELLPVRVAEPEPESTQEPLPGNGVRRYPSWLDSMAQKVRQ